MNINNYTIMKTKALLGLSLLFLTLLSGCSSDDDNVNSALCKTWLLVSYGNESNEVLKEAEGYYYKLSFHPDGSFSGLAYGNGIYGYYTWKDNEIRLDRIMIDKAYWEGSDPDKFFLYHLSDVYTYTVTDKELRLYYSEDQYFKFRVYNE